MKDDLFAHIKSYKGKPNKGGIGSKISTTKRNLSYRDKDISPWGFQQSIYASPYSLNKTFQVGDNSQKNNRVDLQATISGNSIRKQQRFNRSKDKQSFKEKTFKINPLNINLQEDLIYCAEKKYGMSVDLHNNYRLTVIKDKPDRVKVFKKLMEKNGHQNQRKDQQIHKNQPFSTVLTDKFSNDLVADTLTVYPAMPKRYSRFSEGKKQIFCSIQAKNSYLPKVDDKFNRNLRLSFEESPEDRFDQQISSKKNENNLKIKPNIRTLEFKQFEYPLYNDRKQSPVQTKKY